VCGDAEDSQDPRIDPRSNVFLGAVLCAGIKSWPVRIRNLSSRGALVDGRDLPEEGARVRLQRGSLTANGDIAWQRGNHAGIRFDDALSVAEWVSPTGHSGQRRVDMVVAAVRNEVAADEEPQSSNVGDQLVTPELLSRELQQICQLITDLPMSVELAEAVSRIDAVASELLNLARKD
jgi:hypothetical protein